MKCGLQQEQVFLSCDEGQGVPEGEGPVTMETTPEADRNAVRAKKQALLRDKKHIDSSEAWNEEFKAEAAAKL